MSLKEKINILYLLPNLNNNYLDNRILNLIIQNRINNQLNIFILTSGGLMLVKYINLNVKVLKLNLLSNNLFTKYQNKQQIINFIKENNIKLISIESEIYAKELINISNKLDITYCTTIIKKYKNNFWPLSIFTQNNTLIMYKSQNIIYISNYIKKYSTDLIEKKKKIKKNIVNREIIYPGISLENFNLEKTHQNRVLITQKKLNFPEDKFIITSINDYFDNIADFKYYFKTIQLLSLIKNDFFCPIIFKKKQNFKVIKNLEKLIIKFGLINKIKIYHNVQDIQSIYKLSNIIINNNTKLNNFNLNIIEILASKKLLITANIAEINEIIIDKINGFLIPPNNNREFNSIINNVLSLEEKEEKKIVANGFNSIQKFSIEKIYKQTLNFYNKILNIK